MGDGRFQNADANAAEELREGQVIRVRQALHWTRRAYDRAHGVGQDERLICELSLAQERLHNALALLGEA